MPDRERFLRSALLLAGIALLCRIAFLALLPRAVVSNDMGHWSAVAAMLERGENPYAMGPYLNWPPFWMQVIAAFDAVSRLTSIPLSYVIRSFLIVVDVVNIVLALRIASRFSGVRRAGRVLLWGLALNPVALFLVCQHGNFDALIVTCLLVFTLALIDYERSGDIADWLIESFALGIGILIKTIPLVMTPLLALRISRISSRARILGALLVITPAALGLSVIYALSPQPVMQNVLRYRSYPGWFGITGLFRLAHWRAAESAYGSVFPLIALAALVLLGRWIQRAELRPEQLVLLTGTILAALIAFGPGYAAQYIAWPLPFFAITFVAFDDEWRRDLVAVWVTSILTYVVEYLFIADHGQLLIAIDPAPLIRHIGDVLDDDEVRTLLRLPLFAAYAWLVFAARARLKSAGASPASPAE